MAKSPSKEDEPKKAEADQTENRTADAFMREQDKVKSKPVPPPAQPERAKTNDELGIGASDPYPSKEG